MGRLLTAIVLMCVLTFFFFALTIHNGYCGDSGSTDCDFDVGQQASFLIPGLLIIGALSFFGASALPTLVDSSRSVWLRAWAGFAAGAVTSWLCIIAWVALEAKHVGGEIETLQNLWLGSAAAALATPFTAWLAAGASFGVSRFLSYAAALSSGSWLLVVSWAAYQVG